MLRLFIILPLFVVFGCKSIAVATGKIQPQFVSLEIKAIDHPGLIEKINQVNKNYGYIVFLNKDAETNLITIKIEFKDPDDILLNIMRSDYGKISEIVSVSLL